MGDRFTDEEVDELFREAPIDKKGNFNYAEFTRILKHGAKDKDDEQKERPAASGPMKTYCTTDHQPLVPTFMGLVDMTEMKWKQQSLL